VLEELYPPDSELDELEKLPIDSLLELSNDEDEELNAS
jgi:hypothetical protein